MLTRLFLSHAGVDAALAQQLGHELRRAMPTLHVFVSSEPGAITTGAEWLGEIKRELASADAYIVLLTTASVQRSWIWFESGAAFMGAKKVIGLCAPGMPKANVPSPLGAHQLLTLDSPADCTQLFAELGLLIENAELFASTARATAEKCSAAWLEDAGWKGLTHNDRYFAWEGPLEDLADWVDLPCPPGLIKSIESTGMVPSFEEPDKFRKLADQGYRRVFFTNRQTGKRPLTHQDGGRILMVRQKTEEEVQEELRKSALSIEWNNLLVELEKLSQPLGISSESRPESSVSGEKVCWSGVVVTSERHEAITVTLMKKPDGAITEAVKGVHKINFSHRCDFVQSRAGGGYAWRVNRISDSQASVSSFSGDTCMFAAWLTREIQRLAEQER
jgi:hypothetical protein